MIADVLLRIFGEIPEQFSQPIDKWIAILTRVTFIIVPLILIFLLIAPFLFLWWRKKRFTIRNILIALVVSVSLVALALWGLYWGLALLQGLAVLDFYGAL